MYENRAGDLIERKWLPPAFVVILMEFWRLTSCRRCSTLKTCLTLVARTLEGPNDAGDLQLSGVTEESCGKGSISPLMDVKSELLEPALEDFEVHTDPLRAMAMTSPTSSGFRLSWSGRLAGSLFHVRRVHFARKKQRVHN